MKIPKTTKQHQIGRCPACHCGLWADVDIEVTVCEPYMVQDGRATVSARAKVVGMRFEHSCGDDQDVA